MRNVYSAWCRVLGVAGLIFLLPTVCLADEAEDPNAWDFGQVKQGEVVSHTFSLKNESDKTLNITGLNTSCGCTVSQIEREVLLAGESTELEVKFNSKDYSGTVQQFAYVNTDDLDKPVIRFIIKAEVVK